MKAFRLVSLLLVMSGFLGAMAGVAGAAPGDLDRFFGREGIAGVEYVPESWPAAEDMVVGPGNAIYVLRRESKCGMSGCGSALVVTRHHAHGTRDASYGAAGLAWVFDSSGYGGVGEQGSLAMASGGKVVVASTDSGDLVLARLNSDGSLDRSFGAGGMARLPLGVFVERAEVALDEDGRITVGAESALGYGETTVVVSRYKPQGSPDPTFNGGAPVITSLGSGLGGLDLTDSKVVFAGRRCCGLTDSTVHVGQLTKGGIFDRRFGVRGHRFVDDVAHEAQVGAVLALPDGKVVVVGSGREDGVAFALRLLAGGRLDPAFGDHGVTSVRNSRFRVSGAAVDEQGRLVIVGFSLRGSPYDGDAGLTVVRRLANGRPDRTFGGGRAVDLALSEEASIGPVDLQSDGQIVILAEEVSCSRSCSTHEVMLIRYRGGSSGARCMGRRANIVGTRSSDDLYGTPRRDVISALSGDDLVYGRGGNDLICGGRGDDYMAGGPGRDHLIGGPGRDRLAGGPGRDRGLQ